MRLLCRQQAGPTHGKPAHRSTNVYGTLMVRISAHTPAGLTPEAMDAGMKNP